VVSGGITSASSTPVTIVPNASITAGNGLAYWKDGFGMVHLKGTMQNLTGGPITNLVTTNPLPSGFRPVAARYFSLSLGDTGTAIQVKMDTTGAITTAAASTLANNGILWVDGVHFLADGS